MVIIKEEIVKFFINFIKIIVINLKKNLNFIDIACWFCCLLFDFEILFIPPHLITDFHF